jgi:hypothetical protein
MSDSKSAAQNIRKALKLELGATSRDISVKSSAHAGGSSVTVRIVRGDFLRSDVLRIAKRFEELVTDSAGNTLRGCGAVWVRVSHF